MKKFLKYFLSVFILVIFQLSLNNIVSASRVEENYISTKMYVNKDREFTIPMLTKVEQVSPNQIEITYDRDVDMKLGTKATNYWVQDLVNDLPTGIATLGKSNKFNKKNSLVDDKVKIEPRNGSAKIFILTFSQNIPKGAEGKLIICHVTVEGAPDYDGDNGSATFVGK